MRSKGITRDRWWRTGPRQAKPGEDLQGIELVRLLRLLRLLGLGRFLAWGLARRPGSLGRLSLSRDLMDGRWDPLARWCGLERSDREYDRID